MDRARLAGGSVILRGVLLVTDLKLAGQFRHRLANAIRKLLCGWGWSRQRCPRFGFWRLNHAGRRGRPVRPVKTVFEPLRLIKTPIHEQVGAFAVPTQLHQSDFPVGQLSAR